MKTTVEENITHDKPVLQSDGTTLVIARNAKDEPIGWYVTVPSVDE